MMKKDIVRRRIPVTAISSDDVVGLLHRLELYDDVVNGKITCFICKTIVTLENIGGVTVVGGKAILVCDNPGCIARAAVLSKERQHVAGSDEDEQASSL
jgi:hypothetical protein